MVVQHNLTAMNANRYLGINNSKLSKSLEKLSSGYAINRAGDNAAGLAVSEKMRSQIAGMTQGVKNAQDGISMVQTFEGALTETDSILQRMKTLADQMANGSYDDPIDRTAAQQEFLQLNDELDQIADTDFNGVIVLNGGKMADGLEAVDGMFDYANKEEQLMAQAKAMLKNETDAANKTIKDVTTAMSKTKFDLSANGNAPEWNTVDNNQYTKSGADELWKDLGIVDGAGNADTSVVTEVSVTFQYDGNGGWTTVSVKGNDGADYNKDGITATRVDGNVPGTGATSTANGWGGFTVASKTGTVLTGTVGTGTETVTAVFDATTAKAGDTVTLKFTNGTNSKLAPKDVAWAADSVNVDDTSDGSVAANALKAPTIALAATTKLKDDDMTAELAEKFNNLNGLEFKANFDGTANATYSIGDTDLTGIDATGKTFNINGKNYFAKLTANTGVITVYDKQGGAEMLNITTQKATADTAGKTDGTRGTVSGTIALDTARFVDASASIRVDVGENTELGTSASYQKQLSDARDKLSELSKIDVTSYEKAKDYLTSNGVSISDAYDKSEAIMTYKDNITLQTGARTKDAVNFTFKYASDAIGDLEADLNCTAKGLGTADLNLSTQEAANYAIDKIDQAINKVSLVRGTFGAIQNRLEHKIDNMNVSIENLTSAESQIRDTNMPQEMMNFTKQQILAQASQSMLAQANQLPQSVLSLLQ